MAKFCLICGRRIEKSPGPIGPVCLRKMQGQTRRIYRISKEKYIKYMKEHDIFLEENGEQAEDATTGSDSEK
jgi:hypothetical protein